MARLGFWAVITAMFAVYLVMVLWSLPKVAAFAGGLPAFDLRPFGYSDADARAFLAALGDEGRGFYRDVQHRLDLAYPALFAASLALCFGRLIAIRGLAIVLSLVAVGAMVFDYAENALVGRMLAFSGDTAPADLIAQASTATLIKSGLGAISLTGLLIAILAAILRRLRDR